jgi:anthranilate/para-aminobenzoate synthase component I
MGAMVCADCQFQLDGTRDGWSMPSSRPGALVRWDGPGSAANLIEGDRIIRQWDNPLDALRFIDENRVYRGRAGRWVGYLSYDLGRLFEVLPERAADDLKWPWFVFGHCAHADWGKGLRTEEGVGGTLGDAGTPAASTFGREEYLAACRRVLAYIGAGDVFQVNLSQRFMLPLCESPWGIYHRLRTESPAAYGGCLDFGDLALICNSPELFLRVDGGGGVTTRPIIGTRRIGPGMEEELRHSIKDQAELNMIVDLQRNDLGRVCRIGSVKVPRPRDIETHPTLHHGVATVTGRLREDVGLVELLRATFPGGSVTGAPKIRAMQIIDELEPVRRGPYCGAIGYLDADGTTQFNIAIRTMLVREGRVYIPVGGGIVADSDPGDEYEETLVKARAMFSALGIQPPESAAPLTGRGGGLRL